MKPIERILTAVDFSPLSDQALRAAVFLAQKVKGRLFALHVVSQSPFDGHFFGPVGVDLINQLEKKAAGELSFRLSPFAEAGIEINSEVRVGEPFVDAIRFSRQQKVQFLTAGAHGREEIDAEVLGSVAENLIRKSDCPVWIIRGEFREPQKILLLTDLSEEARAGVRLGLFLAKLLGAKAHLIHVFEFPYVPSFAQIDPTEYELKMKEMVREEFGKWVEEAHVSKVDFTSDLLEGRVRSRVLEILQRENFDLIVMSTHGQSSLFHKHLGSVTTYLARHAPCSLITVRPEGFKFKEI